MEIFPLITVKREYNRTTGGQIMFFAGRFLLIQGLELKLKRSPELERFSLKTSFFSIQVLFKTAFTILGYCKIGT